MLQDSLVFLAAIVVAYQLVLRRMGVAEAGLSAYIAIDGLRGTIIGMVEVGTQVPSDPPVFAGLAFSILMFAGATYYIVRRLDRIRSERRLRIAAKYHDRS